MKQLIVAGGLVAVGATSTLAGGVDRSGQSIDVLFEKGNYVELSYGYASPHVSGVAVPLAGGASSGDMAGGYTMPGFAIKKSLSKNLDAALIYDQPFGASVNYPTGTGYFAAGSTAKLTSNALTGLLKYRFDSNVSVYGGVRWQTMGETAVVTLPSPYPQYHGTGATQGAFGYVVGVAYEKPEIAMRIALTYSSKINYNFPTTEYLNPLAVTSSTTKETTPQSINLDFQTGVNPTTLVFGSIRWVDWKQFNITPIYYNTVTGGGSLVSYDHNTITYSIGVGHKFTDHWSGALVLGYEPKVGGYASNLGPTDGRSSIGIGVTYTQGNMKITGGVSYIHIGSAQTQVTGLAPASNFSGNHAIAAGVKVGWSF
jgi:long-chain fatty acid transport protein